MKHRLQWIAPILCLLLLLSLVPARGYADDDLISLTDEEEAEEGFLSEDEIIDEIDLAIDPELEPAEEEQEELRPFSGQYGWLQLELDLPHLEQVGHQRGGQACACYSLAYCRTLLDREAHPFMEYNLGTSGEDAWCDWSLGNYKSDCFAHPSDVYEKIYKELCEGRPCVILIKGPYTAHHYVAVVGFENVVSGEPLTPWNFLILDPCAADYLPENMGAKGFTLNKLYGGTYQLVCTADESSAEREAHKSSYISRCRFYDCSRTLSADKRVILCSLPCGIQTDRRSALSLLPAGVELTATALVENTAGEYWYRVVSSSGEKGYIYAGRYDDWEESCDAAAADLELLDMEDPEKTPYLGGRIFSGSTTGAGVFCTIYEGTDTEGDPLLVGKYTGSFRDLELKGSGLVDAASLLSLEDGDYTIVLSVRCLNYYSTDGKTLECAQTEKEIASLVFSVGDEPIPVPETELTDLPADS